jgi:hypothetical protein
LNVLNYEVRQLHLDDKGMYFLPLPKLTKDQFQFVGSDLRRRGFSVVLGERLRTQVDGNHLSISKEGLAWSSGDLMDAVVPSIARALDFPKVQSEEEPYFAAKKRRGGYEIQFFPRLEGLGRWSSLRRQGDCGLTPDEALVLGGLLRSSNDQIECITDYPTEGCSAMQVGRHQYYSSRIPAPEFVSNLRTISKRSSRNTYLPRNSILRTKKPSALDAPLSEALGQWCYLKLAPQNL